MTLFKTLALAALVAAPVQAAQNADPNWPCVQRRIDRLSLAVMWPNPVPEESAPLPDELQDLADAMALRRVSLEEIGQMIEDVAAEGELDAETSGRIFAEAFERIDRQRSELVSGIVRYAKGQAELAEEIDRLQREMAELEAAEEPDFDRMDEVEAELDWRERVFDDRNSALTYVCETPVLLERRAYAIAQELLERLD